MKKFFGILSVVAALFAANSVQAQVTTPVFDKGDNIVSLTLGYGNTGFGQRLVYERCVATLLDGKASIGVGGALGNSFDTDSEKENGVKVSAFEDWFSINAVGSFHYQFIDKLDTYVQLGLGGGVDYARVKMSYDGESAKTSDSIGFFSWSTSIGARYYFNDKWAANAELGYVVGSFFMAGVTYRF